MTRACRGHETLVALTGLLFAVASQACGRGQDVDVGRRLAQVDDRLAALERKVMALDREHPEPTLAIPTRPPAVPGYGMARTIGDTLVAIDDEPVTSTLQAMARFVELPTLEQVLLSFARPDGSSYRVDLSIQ